MCLPLCPLQTRIKILPNLQRDRMKICQCQCIPPQLFRAQLAFNYIYSYISSMIKQNVLHWYVMMMSQPVRNYNRIELYKTRQRACRHNAAFHHEELHNCQSNESLTSVFGEYSLILSLNLLSPFLEAVNGSSGRCAFRSVSFIPARKLATDSKN